MKKFLSVLFIVIALLAVSCGKGTTGFDKPEDLGSKIADMQNNVDFVGILDFTHFAKIDDKAKIKAFFVATQNLSKKMMEMVKQQMPKLKLAFKEPKIDGDKGQLVFTTGMGYDQTMEIVKVDGKWFLSSADKTFAEALTKDPKKAVKEIQEQLKQMQDRINNMSDEDKKKMEDAKKMMENMPKEAPKAE